MQDLLPPGSVNAATRLVLANAIYFKADWKTKFMSSNTQKQPFFLLDGGQTEVDMMQMRSRHGISLEYADDSELDAEILELPYKNEVCFASFVSFYFIFNSFATCRCKKNVPND